MTRRGLLLGTIAVAVLAMTVLASGSAAAQPSCPDDGVIATVGDRSETLEEVPSDSDGDGSDTMAVEGDKTLSLYEGTVLELQYCENDTVENTDWLDPGEEVADEWDFQEDEGTYQFEVPDSSGTVDLMEFANDEIDVSEASLKIEIVATETSPDLDGSVDEIPQDDPRREYLRTVEALESDLQELNESTEAIKSGDGADLDEAEENLENLSDTYDNMNEAEANLTEHLLEQAEQGNASGAFAAIEALEDHSTRHSENVTAGVDEYQDAVKQYRSEPRSRVQLFVVGSTTAGLVLGLVAGAAVPLLAARRVEEKLKLSRNVNYDAKSALVPIAIGLVLAAVGVALLALNGGAELLKVIR